MRFVNGSPELAAATLAELQKKLAVFEAQKTAEVGAEARAGRALHLYEQSGPGRAAKSVQEDLEAGGLSRATLCSDEWHRSHPKAARHLFGFDTWRETRMWLLLLWDDLQLPTQERGSGLSDAHMTPFEKCLLCKMRIHRAYPLETLALMWGRATSSACEYCNEWMPRWGEAGEDLSTLDITPAHLRHTYPDAYEKEGMHKVCAQVDGKDFMTHTDRSNTVITRASHSNKVEHTAGRCMSWSTAAGLMFEHTDMYLGRVSEKKLVELWGPRLKKCPAGWTMLVDRGFAGTATYYPNMNDQLSPSFLDGRDNFTEAEVKRDYQTCRLRHTCEVAFSRATQEASLQDTIPCAFFSCIDSINHWAHAHANLYQPLML